MVDYISQLKRRLENNEFNLGITVDDYNSFFRSADNFSKKVTDAENSLDNYKGWKNSAAAQQNIGQIRRKESDARVFLNYNRQKIGEETYQKALQQLNDVSEWFDNYQASYKNASDYYSQWESEETYNAAMKQAERQKKEYERLMGIDTNAAKRQYQEAKNRIADLQAELTRANNPQAYPNQRNPNVILNEIKQNEQLYSQFYKDYNDAQQLQTIENYNKITDSQNFEKLAKQGLSIKIPQYKDVQGKGLLDSYSADYDPISRPGQNTALLTDEEKNIYGYLVATKGIDEANQYLKALAETINYRRGKMQADALQGKRFSQFASAVPAGLDQFIGGIQQLFSEDRLPTSATQFASGMVREDLKDVGFNILGTSLGQIGYDLINTSANMAPSILLSGLITTATGGAGAPIAAALGATTTGLSSGGNAYNEALSQGYTPEQAKSYGTLTGAAEGALQYLLGGISKLGGKLTNKSIQNAISKIDNALLKFSVEQGISMLGEGTEEYLQEILTPVFRNIAFDENNEIKPFSEDALYAGLLGALSAGAIEGPSAVSNALSESKTKKAATDSQTQIQNRDAMAEAVKQGIVQDISEKYNYSRIDSAGTVHIYSDVFQNVEPEKQRSFIKKYAHDNYITRFDESGNIVGEDKGVTIKSDNSRVYITGQGINEAAKKIRGGKNEPFLNTILELPAIVENAQFAERIKDEKGRPFYWDNYQEQLTINGTPYRVTLKVKVPPAGGNRYYYHTIEEIKIEPEQSHGTLAAENQPLPNLIRDHSNSVELGQPHGTLATENQQLPYLFSDHPGSLIIPQDTAGVNSSISEKGESTPIRVPETDLKVMETIARKHKISFEISDMGKGVNGKYSDGVIYISPHAKQPALEIFKHELTHHLEKTGRYEDLYKVVKDYCDNVLSDTDFAAEVRKKQDFYQNRGHNLSWKEAEFETVADFAGKYLFTDDATIEQLANTRPNLARSIVNWIREMLAVLKGDVQSELLLRAERKYLAALRQADKRDGIQSKARYSIDPNFSKTYDNWDKQKTGFQIRVGTASKVLQDLGIDEKSIYWDTSKLKTIREKHPQMTDDIIKQVPNILESPVLVMDSQTVKGRLTLFGEVYDAKGSPVLAVLELNPTDKKGHSLNIIKIASAYGKDVNLQGYIDKSNIRYVDKKRINSWLTVNRLKLPLPSSSIDPLDTTVPQKAQSVNTSISETLGGDTKNQYSIADDYKFLVDQYGAIKPGENLAREVKVPRRTDEKNRVRQTVRTAMEATGTPDNLVEQLKADVVDGIYSYKVVTDTEAINHANNRLDLWGFEKCYQHWKSLVEGDKKINKYDMALAQQMYIEAAENGDFDLAQEILADVAVEATRAGQASQAIRILKSLTPQGRLYKIERLVYRIQQEVDRKTKGKGKTIKVDDSLKKRMLKAKSTEEMDAIEQRIHQDISDQMPPVTRVEKWNEWRYLAMLGNPRTHIRNILGNVLFTPAVKTKNAIGLLLEKALPPEQRTKSVLTAKDKTIKDFAETDYYRIEDKIMGDKKYGNGIKELTANRKVFDNRMLERARKLNSNLMEKEDRVFTKRAYITALSHIIKVRGWDINDITAEQLDQASNIAVSEAQKATFRDQSKVANALNKLSKTSKATEILVEGLLPFKKTPINILKRGVEYSPIGLLNGVKEILYDVRKGKKATRQLTAAEAIDHLSAGLTGTGMLIMGMFLHAMGFLRSTSDDDKEKSLDTLSGKQEYALQFGDYSYTIDWIAPLSLPLFVGAEIQNYIERGDADDFSSFGRVIDALTGMSDPLFNLSMLQGINDMFKTIRYSDNPIVDVVANTAAGYVGQAIPTLLGQVSRTIDPVRRNTWYTPEDSSAGKLIDKTVKKIQAKTPLSVFLEPYVNKWGWEESESNLFIRALENFFSPGYVSKNTNDAVTKELSEIYQRSGETDVIPKNTPSSLKLDGENYRLTEKEYTAYQKTLGKQSHSMLKRYMNSAVYSSMTDAERAEVISEIYSYANEKAKKEFYSGRDIPYFINDMPTVKEFSLVEAEGIDLFDYLYASIKSKGIEGDKRSNGDTISGSVKRNKINYMINQLGFSRQEANELYSFIR